MIKGELSGAQKSRNLVVCTFVDQELGTSSDVTNFSYVDYCNEELGLLQWRATYEVPLRPALAANTHEDIAFIRELLRTSTHLTRLEIRQCMTSKFQASSISELNRSIDLVLRLWLMINFRERNLATLRPRATCIEWNDEVALGTYIQSLFRQSQSPLSPAMSRCGPYFTAVFLQKICCLKIGWTTSICDHLRLDRHKGLLLVFPYRSYLQRMLAVASAQPDFPIPNEVLKEAILSLDILFPFWDPDTIKFLEKEKQIFHQTSSSMLVSETPTLQDFTFYRDRLLEIREVLDAPPVSWAQLSRDRRNPQQFWTFWIALIILILTTLSFFTTIIQAWASVEALRLARS